MIINIYGQAFPHGPACIIADEEGLRALKEACEKALTDGSANAEVDSADGEGYTLVVVQENTPSNLPTQYSDQILTGNKQAPYSGEDVLYICYADKADRLLGYVK